MFPQSVEFTQHSENLAAVRKSLTQVERAHKNAIRIGDVEQATALERLHFFTIGVLAEATLRKVVTDPIGFNNREREIIWRVKVQVDRWLEALELAARRHYGVLIHDPVNSQSIGVAECARYSDVRSVLSSDLRVVIEDRNKIAHGQWVWHLKSQQENQFKKDPAPPSPNYSSLRAQSALITNIGELVHLFATSEPAFNREYARLMNAIGEAKSRLAGSEYAGLVIQLRSRRKRPATS